MNNPIGIFDSGVGGLTVLKEIRSALPNESIVYLGDNARNPYGSKSDVAIRDISLQNARFLMANDVKLVVVACNTASAVALKHIRENLSVPVVGVIDGSVRAALRATKNGRIGVIGTRQTIASGIHAALIRESEPRMSVFSKATPLFAPLVEENYMDRPSMRSLIEEELSYFQEVGVDTLILGCTHYPLLKEHIQSVLPQVALIDPSKETALDIARALGGAGTYSSSDVVSGRIVVTDKPMTFMEVSDRFLGSDVFAVEQIALDDLVYREEVVR